MGFRLSWEKGQRGTRVEWIGAEIQWDAQNLNDPRVKVSATESKTAQITEAVDEIVQSKGMVPIKTCLTLAGRAAWIASLIPKARPFVSQLWGAITDAQKKQDPVKASTRQRPKA